MVAQENEICLLQYDNPDAILLRNGKSIDYRRDIQMFGEKEIHQSYFQFQEGDMLILMSDGVTNAGMGKTTYGGWGREEVVKFCEQRWRRRNQCTGNGFRNRQRRTGILIWMKRMMI